MLPLFTALLLAVWMFQPWSVLAETNALDHPAEASAPQRFVNTRSEAAALARLERLDEGVQTPSATPAPTPEPTPPPPPPPTPVPISPMAKTEIEALVCTYSWPCGEALRVMWCESGGRAWAVGRGSNYGLFQINQVHASRFANFWNAWMDPVSNVQWAYSIWARQGWRPWGCRPYR
jgi:hypothetical protein